MKTLINIVLSCLLGATLVFAYLHTRDKRPHTDIFKSNCEEAVYGIKFRLVEQPDKNIGTYLVLDTNLNLHHSYTIDHRMIIDIWGFEDYRDGESKEHVYSDLSNPPYSKDAMLALIEFMMVQGRYGDPDTAQIPAVVTGKLASLRDFEALKPGKDFHCMYFNMCINTQTSNEIILLGLSDNFTDGDLYKFSDQPPKKEIEEEPAPKNEEPPYRGPMEQQKGDDVKDILWVQNKMF